MLGLPVQAHKSVGMGQLYALDASGWAHFDAKIAKAADATMRAVDAETVGLFRKYKVPMPADFAMDCRWKRLDETAPPQKGRFVSDETADRILYRASSGKDRRTVDAAIRATDARRPGMTPSEYYKGCRCKFCQEVSHASSCSVHNAPAMPIEPCNCGILE